MFNTLSVAAAVGLGIAGQTYALVDHGLSHEQLALIRERLIDGAHASWELGTATEALLQLDFPDVSVFGAAPFPPPAPLPEDSSVFTINKGILDRRPTGTMQLMVDGAAADPMSNGVGILIANWSMPSDTRYAEAFDQQLTAIMDPNITPRTESGAISHRTEYPQLWADFMSMVPPSLAYYGAIQPGTDNERTYLTEAYNQCKLYREALLDSSTGTWRHIVGGPWEDARLWATGQGWAGIGMLRVYQTIAKSTLRDEMQWALDDLLNWTKEVVAGTWAFQQEDGSLKNYLNEEGSFREMSSTALMAAVTYRLAVLTDATQWVPHADKAFDLIKYHMVSPEGWLLEPVNPYNFSNPGEQSPEGQAFVLMLQAAYRDYAGFNEGVGSSLASVFNALANAAVQASALKQKDARDVASSHKFARHYRGHH